MQDDSPENAACRELAAKVMQNIRLHARNRTLIYKLELNSRASAFHRDLDSELSKQSVAFGTRAGLARAAESPESALGDDFAQPFVPPGIADASPDIWRTSSDFSGLMSPIAVLGGSGVAGRGSVRFDAPAASRAASSRRARRIGMSPDQQKKIDEISETRDQISKWVDRVTERPITTGGTPSSSPVTRPRDALVFSPGRSLTSM